MKFKDVNVEALVAGLNSALQKKEVGTDPQMMNMFLNQYFQNLSMKLAQENLEKGNKFLEENAKKEGVQTLVDGIQYKVITKGEGAQPKATDMVKVHYKGTLIDGTEFDSSYKRGEPAEFPLNGVIQGWTKALQAMPVGSKWIIYLPAKEAYGQRGGGPIGPNETLIFEVELLEITTPAADQK
jgi:FKBP-type peptidyl-prolyl cis-trans isomerase FklB